jgi:hypothetical protein
MSNRNVRVRVGKWEMVARGDGSWGSLKRMGVFIGVLVIASYLTSKQKQIHMQSVRHRPSHKINKGFAGFFCEAFFISLSGF